MKLNKFENKLLSELNESISVKKSLLDSSKEIKKSIILICKTLSSGGKVLFCGNGGSAADSQHLAAELLVRLRPKVNRRPFPAIALAQDTSTITACGNDFNFNKIFSRNLEALGNKKDTLIAISTSGNSKNIIEVLKAAKQKKIKSIGFYGNKGGKCRDLTDLSIIVKSKNTANIQEAHIFLGHFILSQVENMLLKK